MVFADYESFYIDNAVVNQIANNTAETWQPDRNEGERDENTRQGKIAEEIFETYVETFWRNSLFIKSYDDIRNDNYEKHAPFDYLIWNDARTDVTPIIEAVQNDISHTVNQFVRLSEYTRDLCKDMNVKIAEVKSTQIREKLKHNAGFMDNYDDIDSVRKLARIIRRTDDVFCYPYFKRSEMSLDYSLNDYCKYVKTIEPLVRTLDGADLKKGVIDLERQKQCCDIFIRVYVDKNAQKGFIIGWMQRERLLDYAVNLKKMFQPNKSEKALYFAKNLSETEYPEDINKAFRRTDLEVYASPYTTTNFYHRDINCQFLSGVSKEEIIVFSTEENAIDDGRYTQRCRHCFE